MPQSFFPALLFFSIPAETRATPHSLGCWARRWLHPSQIALPRLLGLDFFSIFFLWFARHRSLASRMASRHKHRRLRIPATSRFRRNTRRSVSGGIACRSQILASNGSGPTLLLSL